MTEISIINLLHDKTEPVDWHHHDVGQFFWVNKGVVMVETEHNRWMVASGCVGWLPWGCRHRTDVISKVEGRILYLSKNTMLEDLISPKLIQSDDFIQALLKRISEFAGQNLNEQQHRLLQVLADEMKNSLLTALQLPLPIDKRARNISYYLTEYPDDRQTQCELAKKFGLSIRTITRLFIKETGMSFAHWRQQSRILYSLTLLEQGESVTNVAMACGYENTSSYITVFRQRFGQTPKAYVQKLSA